MEGLHDRRLHTPATQIALAAPHAWRAAQNSAGYQLDEIDASPWFRSTGLRTVSVRRSCAVPRAS
jgi:hypothetical protein